MISPGDDTKVQVFVELFRSSPSLLTRKKMVSLSLKDGSHPMSSVAYVRGLCRLFSSERSNIIAVSLPSSAKEAVDKHMIAFEISVSNDTYKST